MFRQSFTKNGGAFQDIKDRGIPQTPSYNNLLLRRYLEGELQDPIMATTRRPAYRAILGTESRGTDFIDLQKAIDYLNDVSGGTLFIKAGTYTISSDITMYSNINLMGEDDDLVIFDFDGGSKQLLFTGTAGTHMVNIVISGITFQNRRCDDDSAPIDLVYVDDTKIRDCKFTDNWSVAETNGFDITLDNCQRVEIRNNRFLSSGETILLDLIDGLIINNRFYDTTGEDVINMVGSTSRVKIIANTFEDCASRCLVNNANVDFITFSNNTISGHVQSAIVLGENSDIAEFITISANSFEGASGSGDCIYGDTDGSTNGFRRSSIVGNIMKSFDDDGIELVGGVVHVTMSANVIRDMGSWGCDLGATTTSNILMCNTFFNNTTGDYQDQSALNIVDSNGEYNVT